MTELRDDQPPADEAGKEAPPERPKLQVTIVTGDRLVYAGEAVRLVAPSAYGQITILPGHVALLAALEPGEMIVRRGEEQPDVDLAVGGGFIEVRDDQVIVLADTAERAEEIDVARAEAARRRAQLVMRQYRGTPEYTAAVRALRRSRARLKVAGRLRQRP
ncbi:MAG: ATP synthase F1 subunit epsilon [Chloroflexi bacterium]|nr:ATP synthase F1 subunit epsilon [Chloroflexota bacterium]